MKVSILIPCHNAGRWIAAAVLSALSQTWTDTEVIVIDDGSTDNSVAVLRSFGSRITWETGPNRGGNAARNRLLEQATGKWVQFLDADDLLRPRKVENQLASWAAAGAKEDVIYSPVQIETWRNDGTTEVAQSLVDSDAPLEEQWVRWQLAQTGAVLWNTGAIRRIGGWNEAYVCCQDNEIVLRALQQGLTFHYSPCAEAVYRIWSQQTVCRRDPGRTIQVRTELTRSMLGWLAGRRELDERIRHAAAEMLFEMSRQLATSDLETAVAYHDAARADGLMRLRGPAAPWTYRWAYRLLGFEGAERLARWRRPPG